jgi:hypothetical protein
MTIDIENNERAIRRLIQALQSGRALGFVGGGSSIRVGYPSWPELLEKMAAEVRLRRPNQDLSYLSKNNDVQWRAQELRELLGDDYDPLIRREFDAKDPPCDAFHELLMKLPFQHILTTNYDPVLEHAQARVALGQPPQFFCWSQRDDLSDFLRRQDDPTYGRHIAYVHGRFNDPSLIVLTEKDYTQYYGNGKLTQKALWGFVMMRTLIFVGFGLTDSDLMGIFRFTQAELGGEPHHFAFMGLKADDDSKDKRRYLRSKYGIEPVFYEVLDRPEPNGEKREDHSNLERLVQEIANRVEIATDETASVSAPATREDRAKLDALPDEADMGDIEQLFRHTERQIKMHRSPDAPEHIRFAEDEK